jgi:heme-degrading monooxygenase HmoA
MVYEMRFQYVDPAQRAEYVRIYRDAVQGCKTAGSTGGQILCSDDDPSAVIVILLWESKEHLARWRDTESYKSFRAAVAPRQTQKSHGGFYVAETI